jgi:serine/threonine protein kinase/Tol biopolymer transport system component
LSLNPGTRLGVYEIATLLGAGGMGEVYRATDTKLKRQVAIKILPPALAASPDRLARFQREAEVLAALNHPGIASIYGLEESGESAALIMELVEGDDLSQRIARGAIPTDEALLIAKQIADALEAAHSQGIVHRDLKPANIKLRSDGTVKVLDFGLAKALAPEENAVGTTHLSQSPTITTPALLTSAGIVLGTAAYMAPEQAKGLEASKRSDIWAFGCVVFEMLTARRAFDGEDMAEVLGAVVRLEPPWDALPSEVPSPVRTLLRQCLVKDRRRRIGDIAAAQFVLDHQASLAPLPVAASSSARVAWAVAALAIVASISTFVWSRTSSPRATDPNLVRFAIAPPTGTILGGPARGGTGNNPQVAISPDGLSIVYVAGTPAGFHLWLRPIGSGEARQIPGTDGAAFPFWSPDSQSVAFFAADKLKKVPIGGGPVMVLADASFALGGSWSRDNVIVFGAGSGGLSRVSSGGGKPSPLTTLAQGEDAHRWPYFLPDGRHFFYNAISGTCCPPATPGTIKIGSLDQPELAETLVEADSAAAFVSGQMLFAREETLLAQSFDPATRKLTGEPVPVIESVGREGSRYISASISNNGTLVFAAGGSQNPQQLLWFDRTGTNVGTLGSVGGEPTPALSPDERQLAVAIRTGSPQNLDIWTIDLGRNLRSRVTADGDPQGWPVWSPDGSRIVFGIGSRGIEGLQHKPRLIQIPIGGTATNQTLLDGPAPARPCGPGQCSMIPTDWSSDGRFLLYTFAGTFPLSSDIWALPLFDDQKPFPVVQTQFRESLATFSPDGRWIAYMSDETGELNIYVQPFGRDGAKYRVSPSGGRNPRWRADGKELFYLDAGGAMTAVPIEITTKSFSAGLPKALFQTGVISLSQSYVVTKDGQRFLVNARPRQAETSDAQLNVIINWASTLVKRQP